MSRESHSFPIRPTEANASFEPLKNELNSFVPQLTYGKQLERERAEKSNYWKSFTIYNANER